MRFADWRKYVKGNKNLCFSFKADNLCQKFFVQLQLPKAGRNYKYAIVNGENRIALSDFGAEPEDFQQVNEICFLFEKNEEKEQTNVVIQNLRIE